MTLSRFDPRYFTVNFNVTCAASVVATAPDALLMTVDFRTTGDLAGLIWSSVDPYSHELYRYETNVDYSTTILDCDFVLTNIRALDVPNGPTLTVNHVGGGQSYVRLSNYVTSGTNLAGHLHLDFSVVGGGWTGSDPIDWTNVESLLLSIVHDSFSAGPQAPLDPPELGTVQLSNMTVSGPALDQDTEPLPPHHLRMSDGYDDSYQLTPTRLVEQCQWLGYRDWYSVYMGISHHHDLIWNASEARFVVSDSGSILNQATRAWFTSLLAELLAHGFTDCIISVSYEVVHYLMPTGWEQRDAGDAPGLSGWDPPSQFITPCNPVALDYLANVVKEVFALYPSGLRRHLQVGEPWWWDNSFTTEMPCFYDAHTQAAYVSETSHPVPTPFLESTSDPIAGHEDFLQWLGDKLGLSTLYIRDAVRATYPDALAMALIFTPQIESTEMLQIVNLPTQWAYPGWDILQVEDYDWIIDGEFEKHASTWETAQGLGYTLNTNTHYYAGFVLTPDESIWTRIFYAIRDAQEHRLAEIWVWARPQVFRDGIAWSEPTPVTSLLPPNATLPERALEAATARLADVSVPIGSLWSPEQCPEALLAWLAWALSVDEWNPQWDATIKRAVIAESIGVHLRKGSVASVKRALSAIGFSDYTLTEWWEPADPDNPSHTGEPHTYSLGINPLDPGPAFDPDLFASVLRTLAYTAPVRSHLALYVQIPYAAELGLAAAWAGYTHVHLDAEWTGTPTEWPMLSAEMGLAAAWAGYTHVHRDAQMQGTEPSSDGRTLSYSDEMEPSDWDRTLDYSDEMES